MVPQCSYPQLGHFGVQADTSVFMHLSMSCLHPRVGWGNKGDSTKSIASVKFPTGAKKLVKTPLCPHLKRGVSIGDLIYLLQYFLVQQTADIKSPRGGASIDVKSLVGCTHSKNKLVKVTTNFCHNTHYFCIVTFTTFVVTLTTKSVVNITTQK